MTDATAGDEDGPAERSGDEGPGRLRKLAAAAGVGVIGSLAGCSSEPDPATDDGPDAADPPTQPTVGTSSTAGDGSPRGTATLSAEACRQRAAELESELASMGETIEQLDDELQTLDRRRQSLREVAGLFEPPNPEVEKQALAVGTAAREAVVFLELGGGSATGWYIDDHHIVTNAHNVAGLPGGGSGAATVWTLAGDSYPAETVDFVSTLNPDVAIMRTDERAPATLHPGTPPDGNSGETLVQVGNPGAVGNWVISFGHLQGAEEISMPGGEAFTVLESTVPGRQGVSGSPVLNLDGGVVGLTYGGSDVQMRQPETRPVVAGPTLYDRPIASLSYASHVPIDTVTAYYEEWTER